MKHFKLIPLIVLSLAFIVRASSDDSSQEEAVDDSALEPENEKKTSTLKPLTSKTGRQRKKNFLNLLNFFKKKSSNRTDSKAAKRQRHRLVTKSAETTKISDSNDSGQCPFGCKYCKGGKCKLHKCKHCGHHG